MMESKATVGVYGAYGFTGRLICDVLAARGIDFLVAGRDLAKLNTLPNHGRWPARQAHAEDHVALCQLAEQCEVLLNCAGPFRDTSDGIERAALACHVPALHISCERDVINATFARTRHAAAVGIALVPAAGFSTLAAELMAWLAAKTLGPVRRIQVYVAHAAQVPSAGTLRSYLSEVDEGKASSLPRSTLDFGLPLGRLTLRRTDLREALTLPHLFPGAQVEGWVAVQGEDLDARPYSDNRELLEHLLSLRLDRDITDEERGAATFSLHVVLEDGGGYSRWARLDGCDPYGITAALAVVVAQSLHERGVSGSVPALRVIDPQQALACLAQLGARWNVGG